jgi:hypothetical protein
MTYGTSILGPAHMYDELGKNSQEQSTELEKCI